MSFSKLQPEAVYRFPLKRGIKGEDLSKSQTKLLFYKNLQLVANNFNSLLKLKFFNPSADGIEIFKN
jgi:hypothetical protein